VLLSANALAGYAHNHQLGFVVLAVYRGTHEDRFYYQMYKGLVTEGVLAGLRVPYHIVDRPDGLAIVADAVRESRLARTPVIVLLEGDGDLTMNLGVLVTIAGARPANLRIAVFVNDRYETGGGQPLPNAGRVSYVAIAGGAGFPWTGEAHDEPQLDRLIPALLQRDGEGPGLGLLALHVDPEASPYPSDP